MSATDPFDKFRDLLNQHHVFPCVYLHKFIGKDSSLFAMSVMELEKNFSGLKKTHERLSASGKHLALTFEYSAPSADEVIALVDATGKIKDLVLIL